MTIPAAAGDAWDEIARACAKVSTDRLWRMHEEMAAFGAIPGPGVNRQAFSAEDIAARKAMLAWLKPYGFEVFVDEIANLFIRRPGRSAGLPPVVTGSHMDSQPRGGRFDGIYGVLAGIEVLFALEEAGLETEHPLEVVAWSNEEGSRFAPGAMGSMVYSGARDLGDLLDTQDRDGIALRAALTETLAATPQARPRALKSPFAGYIEAHIEQGPLLEQQQTAIGVVTGIQGTRWFSVDVRGESAHAGTTPLSVRRDAFQAALAVVNDLNELVAAQPDDLRFTIGRFDVSPNSPNSVADKVSFSIDIRHPDAALVEKVGDAIVALCEAARRGCPVVLEETFNRPPCAFVPAVVDRVEAAARSLGVSYMRMASGAFHDALFMHDICPTGMIFVPCERGISHNPAENADPADLATGARVLLAALADLAVPRR